MEFVSKMTRYGITLIPDTRIVINGFPQHKRGVFVSFRNSGDGSAIFKSEWWQETGAKSEAQVIDLLKKHEVCGRNYFIVRETEPAKVVEPKKKTGKKELVEA